MATAAKTYTFAPNTTILAAEANTNFDDIIAFLNNQVAHLDASSAFTAVPSGPTTDPSSANHLSRKSYVDAQDVKRLTPSSAAAQTGLVGGSITANAIATGLLVQGGSSVGTTSGAGGVAVVFPTAFPTGVLTVLVCQGDTSAGGGDIFGVDNSSVAKTGFTWRAYDDAGVAVSGQSRRANWLALGW